MADEKVSICGAIREAIEELSKGGNTDPMPNDVLPILEKRWPRPKGGKDGKAFKWEDKRIQISIEKGRLRKRTPKTSAPVMAAGQVTNQVPTPKGEGPNVGLTTSEVVKMLKTAKEQLGTEEAHKILDMV